MVATGLAASALPLAAAAHTKENTLKGNVNHSVCAWTYGHLSLAQLCDLVKSLGFAAIDLVGPLLTGLSSRSCRSALLHVQ